jgi:hypothetical protein
MKKRLATHFALLLLLLCRFSDLSAQEKTVKYDPARFSQEPVWVEMMNDPAANFYETLQAFRSFWEGYEMPGEPEEMEALGRFKRDIGMKENKPKTENNTPKPVLSKRIINGKDFAFEVKQFKGWLREVEPWVQPDGRILTQEERQALIAKQQQELKTIESKQ